MSWFSKSSRRALRYVPKLFNALEMRACGGFDADGKSTTYYSLIVKFVFADNTQGSNWGDLTLAKTWLAGAANQQLGGAMLIFGGVKVGNIQVDDIDKTIFATNVDATDFGTLITTAMQATAFGDELNAYRIGGVSAGIRLTVISRNVLAAPANEVKLADLSTGIQLLAGTGNSLYGFPTGGNVPLGDLNVIQRFEFAIDTLVVFWGAMQITRRGHDAGGNEHKLINMGGFDLVASAITDTIEHIDIPTATASATFGTMTVARSGMWTASSQHTMISGQGSTAPLYETNKLYRLEIDIPQNDVLFHTLSGTALREGQAGYGGSA